MKQRLSLLLALTGLLATATTGQTPPNSPLIAPAPTPPAAPNLDESGPLDQPAAAATIEKPDLQTLFYAIARAYRLNITVRPDVKGPGLLRFNGGTLRDLLLSLTEPNDLYLEETPTGIAISRTKTEFYFVDYPAVTRTSSSSSSISLSPTTGSSYPSVYQGATLGNTNTNPNGTSNTSDSTSLQIAEKSAEDSLWADISKEIQSNAKADDHVSLNKLTGILAIDTTRDRHNFWTRYIKLLNRRLNAQVMVELRIDQVHLDDSHKLGIDWSQINTAVEGANIAFEAKTDVTSVGNAVLPSGTFKGNFSAGKLSAVIHALQQQGNVRNLAVASTRVLNNQKAFVKVGKDKTFYSVTSNISITQSSDTPQTVTQDIYSKDRQTFGTVMPVYAQIGADGNVTLVLEPARTRLDGIDVSPNGKDQSPITDDQRVNTIVRLKDKETALIGGLTTEDTSTESRKIPFFGSLPLFGALARTDAKATSSTQLLFYVTVTVIE